MVSLKNLEHLICVLFYFYCVAICINVLFLSVVSLIFYIFIV